VVPQFVEVLCETSLDAGDGALERAGEDGADISVRGGFAC
jgi:hypothetical protein